MSVLNVLLIEDNAAHARLVQRYLAAESASVRLSWSGTLAAGLEHLKQSKVDAILLDLGLPDSAPDQTLPRVLREAPGMPVVILTTTDDRGRAVEAVLQGAQDHLPKAQLSTELLVRSIRYAVHRKGVEEQLKALNSTLEDQVAERTAVAEARASELQQLTTELSQAEQRERRRLAQSLHDGLQQFLVAAKMRLGLLATRAHDPKLQELVGGVEALLDESLKASRDLTFELCPPILESGGLGRALEWLAEQMQKLHGLQVQVSGAEVDVPLSPEVRDFLFQAVRELLFNVVKHAGVREAQVRLREAGGGGIELTVEDAGQGGDFSGESTNKHFGLFSIKQRLSLFGGSFVVDSSPQRGTRITLCAPTRPAGRQITAEAVATDAPAEGPSRAREHVGRPNSNMVRVLLVDDHKVVREGLAGLLNNEDDIEVIGEASDGEAAVEAAASLAPDVVLMDVNLPGISGIEATRRIAVCSPDTKVIGLSMHSAAEVAASIQAAGAVAYLSKGDPSSSLLATIRQHHTTARLKVASDLRAGDRGANLRG